MNLNLFFPKSIIYTQNKNIIIKVPVSDFVKVVYFLQKHSIFKVEQLIDVTAVDYTNNHFRFELAYQFLSVISNKRITLVVSLNDTQSFDSISSRYSSAE
jgi:NADH:ubiquinone oxidoreductase subunit C